MQFQVLAALALPAIVSALVIHVPHPRPIPTWVEDKVHSVEHNVATKIHSIKSDITSVIAVEKSIWTTPPSEWTTPPAIPTKWTTPPAVPTIVWDDKVKRDGADAKLNERLVIHVPHPPKVPAAWHTPPPVPTFEWDDKVKAKRDEAEAKLNERLVIHVPHPPKVPAEWTAPPAVPTFEWDDKVKRANLDARWEFGLDDSCVQACTNAANCKVDSYTTLHDIVHCGSDAVSCASGCFSWDNNKAKAKRSEEAAAKLNERLTVHVPHAPSWEEINEAIPAVPTWTPPAVPNWTPPAVPTIVWDDSSKVKRANLNARWEFGLDESCVHACVDNADCTVTAYTTLHDVAHCGADAVSCAADCFSWSN